jgi:hypothetical protein
LQLKSFASYGKKAPLEAQLEKTLGHGSPWHDMQTNRKLINMFQLVESLFESLRKGPSLEWKVGMLESL